MQLSQPTLEPHSLCYTCWVQVVYSLLPLLCFFPLGYATTAQFLPTRGSSLSATRTTSTSRRSSPSRRPYGALLSSGEFYRILYFPSAVSDIFVINVINNIRTRFIISFYVICAVIYCSLCCIYVWLDPGTYMIVRFLSFINRVLHYLILFLSCGYYLILFPDINARIGSYSIIKFRNKSKYSMTHILQNRWVNRLRIRVLLWLGGWARCPNPVQ